MNTDGTHIPGDTYIYVYIDMHTHICISPYTLMGGTGEQVADTGQKLPTSQPSSHQQVPPTPQGGAALIVP